MKTILIAPLITEKSMLLAQTGWFSFKVAKENRKEEIAKAIENTFKVHVVDIKTITTKEERKRTGRKRMVEVRGAQWKKAIVKLKKDEKIDLFDITESPKK